MVRKSHHSTPPSKEGTIQLTPDAVSRQQFGRRLHRILLDRDMTQSDLSRASGIGRDAVSNYIHGHHFPTARSLERLCKALDLTRDELLPNALMNAIDDEHPELEIKVAAGHPGKAWLRINRAVSFKLASHIASLINQEDEGNDE